MKKTFFPAACAAALLCVSVGCTSPGASGNKQLPAKVTLTKEVLMDKIKGGWAGQTIGCSFGGPTEFKYNGTMIQDYVPIEWDDDRIS